MNTVTERLSATVFIFWLCHRKWLILAEIHLQRLDEKNTRKTSVLRRRIPSAVCNWAKHEVFHSIFPNPFQTQARQGRQVFVDGNVLIVRDLNKSQSNAVLRSVSIGCSKINQVMWYSPIFLRYVRVFSDLLLRLFPHSQTRTRYRRLPSLLR